MKLILNTLEEPNLAVVPIASESHKRYTEFVEEYSAKVSFGNENNS